MPTTQDEIFMAPGELGNGVAASILFVAMFPKRQLPGFVPGLNAGKMQLSRILDPASCGVITREHGRMPDYGARMEAKRMPLDQKSPGSSPGGATISESIS